jgi:prepilin peptidase CpaA
MEQIPAVSAAILAAVVVWAAVCDVRARRIPNALTVAALLVALVLRGAMGGGELLLGLAGFGMALLVLVPLFALGGVGGGDVKLLAAVGAFLGPTAFIVALLATAIAGGAMSLAWAIRRGVILPVLFSTGGLLKYVITFGHGGERTTRESPGAVSVPYAIAIAAGTLFALWYGTAL